MSNKIISQLLAERGPRLPQTVSPDSSVAVAAGLMMALEVGSLVVVDDTQKVIGIVSERDIVNKVAAFDKLASQVKVSEIMTKEVETVSLQTNLNECEEKMKRLHIRHLPVVDKGKLLAVISIRDLLVSTRNELEHLVMDLEKYINPFLHH